MTKTGVPALGPSPRPQAPGSMAGDIVLLPAGGGSELIWDCGFGRGQANCLQSSSHRAWAGSWSTAGQAWLQLGAAAMLTTSLQALPSPVLEGPPSTPALLSWKRGPRGQPAPTPAKRQGGFSM